MSYIRPSVLVYQDLLNSGGAANSTPDLEACIIGPAYNSLSYVAGSIASQVLTAAVSATSTSGYISSGAVLLTVASTAGFTAGDSIVVSGAGTGSANLQANIVSISGNVITLDSAAGTSIVSSSPVLVFKSGKIANANGSNVFSLPGQQAGQVVDPTSIVVWLSNTRVQTANTGAEGYYTGNQFTFRTNTSTGTWSTGSISASSPTLTLAAGGGSGLIIGDSITVAGAGTSGALLTTTITNIVGDVLTVSPSASTTVTSVAVTKILPVNLNGNTNTLRAESGDSVVYSYTNNNGVATTKSTSVQAVVTSSGLNGTLVSLTATDSFPSDLSYIARASITSGSNTLAVTAESSITITAMSYTAGVVSATATAHGLSVGNTITISGVTPSGYNGVFVVASAPTASTFTYALSTAPAVVTVQGAVKYGTNVSGMAIGSKVIISGAASGGADLLASITAVTGQNMTLDTAAGSTVVNGMTVVGNRTLSVSVRKLYNDKVLPSVKPLSGGSSYDTSSAATTGQVTVQAGPELSYGQVMSADVYFAYSALRTDLCGTVMVIDNLNDLRGTFGTIDDTNPLALGCQIALANTTTRVRAIAIPSVDLAGYLSALSYAEGERVYFLTPLTQDLSILTAFKAHVDAMSTPENASWRVTIVNTAIPTSQNIGTYGSSFVNANGGTNNVTVISGAYVMTVSNATFISDGVIPGDSMYFTASSVPGQIGAHKILQVISNQQVSIQTSSVSSGNSYYISRSLTKTQSANAVAATSKVFGDKRAWHVQPDTVGVSVNGVTKFLPGYYLCCGLAGMGAGFPVQQGFTNIGVAGITDLKKSNFYFSKADINNMAGAGTCLFVQETQGGTPYVRHELTSDMSVLEYREMLVVKNWDFLSYFYYDKLQSFIGTWNITPDTLNTLRQSITASSEVIKVKKLPKIGSPLLDYSIVSLTQNPYNKDNVDVQLKVSVVYPLNYLNLHLVI